METLLDFLGSIRWWQWVIFGLVLIAIYDIFINKKHAVKHNFPIVGHLRYILEDFGPELRQYIVANNREELPFDRIERTWIYTSAKNGNNYKGFGTDRNIYESQYIFVNNAMMPFRLPDRHPNKKDPYFLPSAKTMGKYNDRKKLYIPASVINVSAMSFGSLSGRAVEALNRGVEKANAYHNTGEGGLSPYHKKGGDIILQIGTAYFGVRDEKGNFSMKALKKLVEENPQIRAIEIKLSQGAKPGKGGVLPATKITEEISKIRRVPIGRDVISPPYHTAFEGVEGLIDFVEEIAAETGLPVGIKAAIGKTEQWKELARLMKKKDCGPDFITIDGGEGGTGAAPPSFADHVSMPWVYGFSKVYQAFKFEEITDRVVFIGSGRLGFPSQAAMAFAMGADCINVAREAMMSIGCIQAQKCHTNNCPTGVTTQKKWLEAGINVKEKAERVNYYFKNFRKELLEITHACGYEHPSQFVMEDIDVNLSDQDFTKTLAASYGYHKVKVPFKGMADLQKSPYLGGKYNKEDSERSFHKDDVRY